MPGTGYPPCSFRFASLSPSCLSLVAPLPWCSIAAADGIVPSPRTEVVLTRITDRWVYRRAPLHCLLFCLCEVLQYP